MNKNCRVCRSHGNHARYIVEEMMFGYRDRFEYFQCSSCKCLQIADIPGDMEKYYPPQYYSFTPKKRRFLGNPVDTLFRRIQNRFTIFPGGLFGRMVSTWAPNKKLSSLGILELTKDSRVLDVGCGDGWRLYILKDLGFRTVLGIDPFLQDDIHYDNGLTIRKQSIFDVRGEWDLVMYHHSFEHVPDPQDHLQVVSQLLPTGGCCLVRTPTVSSYAWEHYREHWVQLDAPRHYMLHSIESMGMLAEQAGFTINNIVFDSTKDQFQGSELYKRGLTLASGDKVFPASQRRLWKKQAQQMNRERRGDQAAFYLIKK